MIPNVKKILFISAFFLLSTTLVNADQYRVIATEAARSFWNTGNGYCGSWSVQNVGITMGFWMGQNQGRKLIGNKEVLLGVNMDKLLDALNLTYVKNYHEKDNQRFLEWATTALINKEPVIIGVKCHDSWCQDRDYDHIIPWHAVDTLNSTYNADDVIYFSDGFEPSEFNMLFGQWAYGADDPNQYWYLPSHNRKTNWGVKITGMKGDDETIPISLTVNQDREPNIAEGESGTTMTGSVNMTGLLPGTTYTLLRWDVDYTRYQNVPVFDIRAVAAADDIELTFTAQDTTYAKDVSFYSDGITIFKLIKGTLEDELPDELPDDGDNGNDDGNNDDEDRSDGFLGLYEDFEAGHLNGWTIEGDNAGIEDQNIHSGSHAAWLQRKSALALDLDVSMVNSVTLSYWVDTWKLDRRERIYAETSTDGRNWTVHYAGRPTVYTYKSHTIDVKKNDLLYLRFRTNANRFGEYGFIDDIIVESALTFDPLN